MKTNKSKNIRKFILGLFVAAFALVFSAFTNAESNRQTEYGVLNEDANFYYVSLASGTCAPLGPACRISTTHVPDEDNDNAVPKDGETTIAQPGTFTPNPSSK